MFQRRQQKQQKQTITFTFEGHPVNACAGESLCAALLASGLEATRITQKEQHQRAPYCQMGVCFECLVTVDGKENQQSCMIPVQEGMLVTRQQGVKKVPRPSQQDNSLSKGAV